MAITLRKIEMGSEEAHTAQPLFLNARNLLCGHSFRIG